MSDKYKIILNYIKDLSVEIPNPETLITARNNIGKYEIKVNISSIPLKQKMMEVTTKLTYADPSKNKNKAFFEIKYATVVDILDSTLKKKDLEKIILCDLQIEIYPELEKKVLDIINHGKYSTEKKIRDIKEQYFFNKEGISNYQLLKNDLDHHYS